jgi:hypothetical protein
MLLQFGNGTHATQPALTAGMHLDGLVTGLDRNGHPLVRTTHGVLALPASPMLAIGTRVTLELVNLNQGLGAKIVAVPPADLASPLPQSLPLSSSVATSAQLGVARVPPGFPQLADALAQLKQHDPALAGQVVRQLPGGNGDFVQALIGVMMALRRGDLGGVIGTDGARTLERLRERPALDALRRELDGTQRLTTQEAADAWDAMLVPIADGGSLGQLGVFVRHHVAEDDEQSARHPVRLLIEATPSAIGPLQLDGLMVERRLDLILRSHAPLPEVWRNDLRAIFSEAKSTLNMGGQIVFQVMPKFPVNAMSTLRPSGGAALTA